MSFRARLAAGIMLILSFALVFVLEKKMTVKPTPESQSIFFKQYDPSPVFNNFRDAGTPLAMSRSVESTGNWGFVSHRVRLHPELSIEPGRREALLAALQHDVESRIKKDGGTIVRVSPEPPLGFQVGYEIGPSRGGILVKPAAATANDSSQMFKLDITIQEMWSEAAANRAKKS